MKKKRQVTSNRLNVNAGIMSWYVKELKKLTKQMTTECSKEIGNIYKKLGYQVEFATLPLSGEGWGDARVSFNCSPSPLERAGERVKTAFDDSISSQIRMKNPI